jgi:hypothetical protein
MDLLIEEIGQALLCLIGGCAVIQMVMWMMVVV